MVHGVGGGMEMVEVGVAGRQSSREAVTRSPPSFNRVTSCLCLQLIILAQHPRPEKYRH